MTTNRILVDRLLRYYDPYTALGVQRSTYLSKAWQPAAYIDDFAGRTTEWHYGRIEHFIRKLRTGEPPDEIVVDMNWYGSSCTGLTVIDGHHRLIAADIVDEEFIPASCGGIVDIIEWLEGKHNNPPEF